MRKICLLLLFVSVCCLSYGRVDRWKRVRDCYDWKYYEMMKREIDRIPLTKNRDSVMWLNWMGEYYYWLSYENRAMGDSARYCFNRAIEIGRGKFVSNCPFGFFKLHLGEVEYLYGNYDEAINCLNDALDTFPYRSDHPSAVLSDPCPVYKGLAMCYAMKGEYERALGYLDSCQGSESGATSSVRMRGKILAMKGDMDESRRCYQTFIDAMRTEVRDSFVNAKNDTLRETWWMGVRPFITDCWRLEGAATELLYDVALMSKGILLQNTEALGYKYSDVRSALKDGEVAIEWLAYEKGGKKRFGAVVMPKEGELRFVETGLVADFDEWLIEEYSIYEDYFARQMWNDQMMSAIGGADKIYFAPDGVLNQIGIEYLFPDTTKKLYRLTSTRELIKRRAVDGNRAAAVVGDMDYDKLIAVSNADVNDELAYQHLKTKGVRAKKLEHSLPECDSVMAARHNDRDTLLINKDATEQNFRALSGKYGMLLISTHGYYRAKERLESSDFPRRDAVDRTMSESGLLFSGVNSELSERQSDLDGIVSAKELSELDLSGVDVCVVSACEGARGQVSVDGTYGLQRGLKAAGVGGMVLSLWEVNDDATSVFMTRFFELMAEGVGVHDAFWQARSYLMNFTSPDGVKSYATPSKYNAFILIDVM